MDFLPVSMEEINELGWDAPDFVLVSGDAYVDHPSFGAAIIGRLLESRGYNVAMLPQPDWKSAEDFRRFGRPKLGFLVTSGNIDSMVNHYSVAKKRRQKDLYSPEGQMGLRPDRALIVYTQRIREAYGEIPVILGGIEASLRRTAHYDYWDDRLRKSVLLDSQADLLVYGMGEHQIIEIAEALQSGLPVSEITFIKGTVYKTADSSRAWDALTLPAFMEISADKKLYAKSFMTQYENTDCLTAKPLIEPYGGTYIVQNAPAAPLGTQEFDSVYALKYMKACHPMYGGKPIPALNEVKFSLVSNRGCYGSCNFCALGFHQGRTLQVRSHKSLIQEATAMTYDSDFKGYIHDVGGPTANFREKSCKKQETEGVCLRRQCLFPTPCKNLKVSHKDYLQLLRKLREIEGIKKVFVRSGIRYDYLLYDKDETFFEELCKYHISGQLKVAPEHVSAKVLSKMGKPSSEVYDRFYKKYNEINKRLGMKQFVVPYLMSSHPGSDLKAAVELAEYLRDLGHMPEQVQDFYPTPHSLSTCMYYTGLDPRTMEPVYIPKTPHEKAMQRALIQYRLPQNYTLVTEALRLAGREDLIGFDKKCLIRPRRNDNIKNETYAKEGRAESAKPKQKKKSVIRNVHKKKS